MNTITPLRSALVAATLVLSASTVCAAPQGQPTTPAEQEVGAAQTTPRDLQAFRSAKVALSEAIATAEKHSRGGKLVDVTFDAQHGNPVYRVKTYQNNAVWEGIVDARSGQVIGAGQTTPESALDSEDTAELAGLRRAAVSLADAVKIAEQRAAGKAMNAGLEQTNGKIVYEITIVKGDSARKIVIDPASGQLVSG